MADESKPQFIRPPSTLQAKVGNPGPGGVDASVLERAEEVIAGLADNYLDWVQEDLQRLQEAFDDLRRSTGQPGRRKEIERVFEIAHDMKGQGGSFGFQLITVIGNQLCRFIEKMEDADSRQQEAIGLHINAMKLVIANGMKGDGGPAGERLVKGLELVLAKLAK